MNEFKKERIVYAFALLLTVITMIYFWNQNALLKQNISEIAAERDQYQASVDSMYNADRELLPVTRFNPLTEQEWRGMVNKGLPQPQADIRKSLQENAHLIPFDGVLGGTPNFYDPGEIHILNDRWVLAAFEDGHVMGHLLLEYQVMPGGEINWQLLEAYLK